MPVGTGFGVTLPIFGESAFHHGSMAHNVSQEEQREGIWTMREEINFSERLFEVCPDA